MDPICPYSAKPRAEFVAQGKEDTKNSGSDPISYNSNIPLHKVNLAQTA